MVNVVVNVIVGHYWSMAMNKTTRLESIHTPCNIIPCLCCSLKIKCSTEGRRCILSIEGRIRGKLIMRCLHRMRPSTEEEPR